MNNIIVTVISVVYNDRDKIEATIQSIVNQDCEGIEYVIIDGGSTDGTIDVIKKYNDKISFWISEPDKGIYDAMNKGAAYANGKWILNVNAGDTLIDLPLNLLTSIDNEKFVAICGNVILDGKLLLKPKYNWTLNIKNTLPHQAMLYNRELMKIKYNLNYKVFADYAYNLGIYKQNQKVKIIDFTICNHSTDGISNQRSTANEFFQLVKTEAGFFYMCLSFMYFKVNGFNSRLKKIFNND